jgi:hypothetical protein
LRRSGDGSARRLSSAAAFGGETGFAGDGGFRDEAGFRGDCGLCDPCVCDSAAARAVAGTEAALAVFGAGAAWTGFAAGEDTDAGVRAARGLSPKRVRQLPHRTTGSLSAGRTTSNRRHPRREWHTAQLRPARSISIRSSPLIGFLLRR